MRGTLVALLACAALLGCSEDEPESEGEPTTTGTSTEATSEGDEEISVECVTDAVATFADAGEIALQDGKAVGLGGPAYTIFAGDYDVPTDGLSINGAQAGPGQHLAFVATTVYNGTADSAAIEIGTPIEWTQEFEVLTFAVVLDNAGQVLGTNEAAAGTLTVTGLDNTSICVEVDYSDAEKSVVGTIAADIV